MGADAHTASLFPGSPAVAEQSRLAAPVAATGDRTGRVTLTVPVLNAAARVVFMVAGADKAPALAAVHGGFPSGERPASLIRPVGGAVWLVDRAAAANLRLTKDPS
jgi:6-phosphogluconolactonase